MTTPISIRYDNTVDDLVAFSEHTLANSPTYQRMLGWGTWTLPALVLTGCVVVALIWGTAVLVVRALVFGLVFGLAYALIYRAILARGRRRRLRSLHREGRNDAALCEHVLEVTPEGLVERTPVSEGRTAWAGIGRVETTPMYAFIYTQAHAAHVIPRAQVEEDDLDRFMLAVRDAVERAQTEGIARGK